MAANTSLKVIQRYKNKVYKRVVTDIKGCGLLPHPFCVCFIRK